MKLKQIIEKLINNTMAKIDKNIRRIKYLLYKLKILYYNTTPIERINEIMAWENLPNSIRKDATELKLLLDNTNISQEKINKLNIETIKSKNDYNLNQNPIIRRDNKGIYIGGSGYNKNKVRYPSKKRSLKTWRMFYNMFPYCAKMDNWNGKISDKMK